MAGKSSKLTRGNDLLYRFFTEFINERPELAVEFLSMMYSTMGIWFPLDTYYRFPILLPWVVRDRTCRGNKRNGIPDQWGSPNEYGFQRDDNSLIKSLPRSLTINGTAMPEIDGVKMGTEFVASHVWREVNHSGLASTHPLLNSFIPNLVWLPNQVSKLTDREGQVMQRVLQSLAWHRYRHAPVAPELQAIVDEAWKMIPEPNEHVETEKVLNTFRVTDGFLATRRSRLELVIRALDEVLNGEQISSKVISGRYGEGLNAVSSDQLHHLRTFLRRFITSDAEHH